MNIEKSFTIKCKKCNNIIEIDPDDLEESIETYDEREMGTEMIHHYVYDNVCPECGNKIEAKINLYEYPIGAYNNDDNNIVGGEFLEPISFGYEDEYYEEFESKPNEYSINTFEEYVKIIEKHKEITTFRGQVNKHWELIPSGFRENSKNLRLYSDKDLILFLKEFKSEIKANITNDISNYTDGEWEIYAQHYGLPTRLLDVSFSPLTALLFAVEDSFDSSSVDAVVWGFNTNAINVSQFGNEEILNLSTDHYNFDLLKKPCFIKSATLNKRLLAQKGAFICFDKNYRNQIDILKENAIKIIIPKEYKKNILNSLFHFGINFYGLYPDIDSISKDIKMKKALESECEEQDE